MDVVSLRLQPHGTCLYVQDSIWRHLGHSIGLLLFLYPEEAGRTAALAGVASVCVYFALAAKQPSRDSETVAPRRRRQ